MVSIMSLGYEAVVLWMKKPINAVLLMIFILALFHHTQLGIQVVIEDYVSSEGQKLTCIILVKFLALFAGLASILAVLTVFLGL
jgi:succinate dehydrogenase / fumarate reductase membrane anchor subunit